MMKRGILFSGLMLLCFLSDGQVLISLLLGDKLNSGKVDFGLAGGVNFSTIKNLNGAGNLPGFNLGFYFDIKLKNPSWLFNTGVIVKSPMGADELPLYSLNDEHLDSVFAGGSVTRKLRYFSVPVMIKYKFRNHFFVKGGIQLGLRNKAFDLFTNSVKDKDDLEYKIDIKNQYHTIDAGLGFGVGYHLMKGNGMNLDLQYYHGLADILIDESAPKQYNRVIYLTAGIPIGKNPKKKKTGQVDQSPD